MFKKLNNIGDCGIVCDFGNEVNREINTSVIKLFHHVKKEVFQGNLKGILNYTPSYNKLIINFDLGKTNSSKIIDFLQSVDFSKLNFSQNSKKWTIPICYDFEMDLENISKNLKIDEDEKRVQVFLDPDEVSRAIGKGGFNIRLAGKLTGYEIDVYREGAEEDVELKEFSDEIDEWVIEEFRKVGLDTAKSILELEAEDLIKRTDLEEETVMDVLKILKEEFED